MYKFTHVNATTLNEATAELKKGQAVVSAGGTALVPFLRGMFTPNPPQTIVNIKTIPTLAYIKEESGMLKIGALTRLVDVFKSSVVQTKYTALAQAARQVGSPELRNMGTVGGNICQGIQCWFYKAEYNTYPCLRKNSQGICYAIAGDNRFHSIFGAVNGCVAVNPSDTAPALIALNAKIVTSKQTVDAEKFFATIMAPAGEGTTVLARDEIVTEIQVPAPAAGVKSAFVKFALRKSFDFPIVNCAAAIGAGGARICLNAVHNLPRRATAAEDAVKGKTIDDTVAEAAGTAAVTGAAVLSNNKYMVQIAKTLVKRAVLACK